MSEEATVNNERLAVINEEESRQDAGGTNEGQAEKVVPVSEAIRYRKRAQAAEKELSELKERAESLKSPSPLRGTGPLQGESLLDAKSENPAKQSLTVAPDNPVSTSYKTQGVKETRTSGARGLLQNVAKQAARSGSRSDVQEYLRVRRQYV